MDIPGTLHYGSALGALALGAVVALGRKGTPAHRWLGRAYLAAMLLLNFSALTIYDLFGGFGAFHWMALASLATLLAGYGVARRRRRGWVRMHGEFMGWSYVGLLAAAVAESVSRIPGAPFGVSVTVSSLIVLAVGGLVLKARLPASVRSVGAGDRR